MKCWLGFCNKFSEFDERQLLIRGHVFKHTVILYMCCILADGFLEDCGIHWASGLHKALIMFWLGAAPTMCEYILRGVTPAGSRNDILYVLEGIFGLLMTAVSLFHILVKGAPIISGRAFTRDGGILVIGLLTLLVFVTYITKIVYDKRHSQELDEE